MLDLVEDESLVVVSRVVLDDVVHWERREQGDGAGREGEQGKKAENSQGKPWSSVPVKGGTPLALKASGQGRFIHCQCFLAL